MLYLNSRLTVTKVVFESFNFNKCCIWIAIQKTTDEVIKI